MITVAAACKAVGILSLMKFFPSDEAFRAALVEMLGEMCRNDEQVLWLARRTRNLYAEWPGAHELRAVLCSKYRPKDGIEADSHSPAFVEGIPSEKEITAPPANLLPPANSEAARILADAAKGLKRLPAAKSLTAAKPEDACLIQKP